MEIPKNNEVKLIKMEDVERGNFIVSEGEEFIIKNLARSEVVIKRGAKLTVTEVSARNKITVEEGGELVLSGVSAKDEIINLRKIEDVTEPKVNEDVEEAQAEVLVDKGIEDSEEYRVNFTYLNSVMNLSPDIVYQAKRFAREIATLLGNGENISDKRREIVRMIFGEKANPNDKVYTFDIHTGVLVLEEHAEDNIRFNEYLNGTTTDLRKRNLIIKPRGNDHYAEAKDEIHYKYILDKIRASKK